MELVLGIQVLVAGALLPDGGAAGDFRHGGGMCHCAHGGAQHPHHVPRLHQPGPVGPAAAHRPPLEKPERDPGRHLHRLSGLPSANGGGLPVFRPAGGAGYLTGQEGAVITDTFEPTLTITGVTFNGAAWTSPEDYTYDAATGTFATVAGKLTVPEATFTQNADGSWTVTPGQSILTVTGTV